MIRHMARLQMNAILPMCCDSLESCNGEIVFTRELVTCRLCLDILHSQSPTVLGLCVTNKHDRCAALYSFDGTDYPCQCSCHGVK